MSEATREELCIAACADAFRGDGEILASPMGDIPKRGVALAKATFSPDLVLTDGVASLAEDGAITGWMPYRRIFDVVWSGKRHVMMGATQIDRYGNQNISCVGDWRKPKVQLLGVRGAPGNTINHTTSYWVPNHDRRVFVAKVDLVCGIGYDRAAELGEVAARFHEIRRVVTNLGVFDFQTPQRTMRLVSLHPGVTVEEVRDNTGFELAIANTIATTRVPDAAELELIRRTAHDN